MSEPPRSARPYAYAIVAIAAATGFGLAVLRYLTPADVTMLYLIAIALASLGGRGPALLAASLAVLAFCVFFVPPRFNLWISDVRHLSTFGVMFGAGLAISTLTVRLRRQERAAVVRERDTAALLAFTRDIAAATTAAEVAELAIRHVERACGGSAAVLVPRDGGLAQIAGGLELAPEDERAAREAIQVIEQGQVINRGEAIDRGEATERGEIEATERGELEATDRGEAIDPVERGAARGVLAIPLAAGDTPAGVLVVRVPARPKVVSMLESFARQAGLALARLASAEQAHRAELRAHAEELRSSLLAGVSHDLRTPLSVITGAATTLRDDGARLAPAAREELLGSIVEDAQRLERVLKNILQLTRVESGVVPNRESIPVEEIVGGALTQLEGAIGEREVALAVPSDLHVSVDPVLFEQALINVLDNALKHGAPPIEVGARRVADRVELAIRDHGPGIAIGDPQRLFERFVRASAVPGAGLGLSVVRAIVEAHGGTVRAESLDSGARFRIELPAEGASGPRWGGP